MLPSHRPWDSDPIGAHAREPEILITPNQPEVMLSGTPARGLSLMAVKE